MEPKALAILAGLTPPDVEVVAFDDRFERMPYGERWDLVALSVGTYEAQRAYEIATRFRTRGVKVVLGGFHPTFCPDEASEHADVVGVGEAEVIWPAIVEDARRARLKPRYVPEERSPLEDLPPPRQSVLGDKPYAPISIVQYGRGCCHSCDFCAVKAFYGKGVCYRPVRDVLAEIELAQRRRIFFCDDNLVADRERAKELLEALIPRRVRWFSQVSLDFVDDAELLELMVRSGCQCVIVGLESLDPAAMRQMGKGWSKSSDYVRRLKVIRRRGIMIYGTFVFGYDADGPDAFGKTLDFAVRQKLMMANFNQLQPFPGTRLYERLQREGRLIYDRWWLDPRFRFGEAVFHPRGMTAAQLTEGAWNARTSFHSGRSIARRLLDGQANLGSLSNGFVYLLSNLASRQDIDRKQGITLGLREPGGAPRRLATA
jgi:radical SAM superfamily enzyme YgiQ (UPF0313 family)